MLTKRTLLAGMAATGFGLAGARPAWAQTYPTRPAVDGDFGGDVTNVSRLKSLP